MEVRTGILEGFTAQDLMNLLNDSIYDTSLSGRYTTLKNFHPPTLKMERRPSKIDDAVVNVIIWGRWEHYKWAYISLISALTHTDIGKFKIRVIIKNDEDSRNKIEPARAIFEPLGIEVILMDFQNRPDLILKQKERYQIIFDADTMMIDGEYPLFNNTYNLLKADSGFYCASPDDAWDVITRLELNSEGVILPEEIESIKEYWEWNKNLGFIEVQLDEKMEDSFWPWNIFYALDRNKFDNKKWEAHLEEAKKLNWNDEEGIIQLYLWSENIKVQFIRNLFGIKIPTIDSFDLVLNSYISGDNSFSVYHPFNLSYTLEESSMVELLNTIFLKANKKMDLCYDPLLI